MKEKEAQFNIGHQQVLYVEKEDGEYGPVLTHSFMAENYQDVLRARRLAMRAEALRAVQAGETSPIAYWRTVLGMSVADLAERVDMMHWWLRRQETPRGYAGVTAQQRARYAEVFGVAPDAIDALPLPDGGAWRYGGEK